MSTANIKIPTDEVKEIKRITGESTGQKAIQKALLYFIKEARQRKITQVLDSIEFAPKYNLLKLRNSER
jgi:hypothetical protein